MTEDGRSALPRSRPLSMPGSVCWPLTPSVRCAGITVGAALLPYGVTLLLSTSLGARSLPVLLLLCMLLPLPLLAAAAWLRDDPKRLASGKPMRGDYAPLSCCEDGVEVEQGRKENVVYYQHGEESKAPGLSG